MDSGYSTLNFDVMHNSLKSNSNPPVVFNLVTDTDSRVININTNWIANQIDPSYTDDNGKWLSMEKGYYNVTGDFISNSSTSIGAYIEGGLIKVEGATLDSFKGDVIGNNIKTTASVNGLKGGMIYNRVDSGETSNMTGIFANNSAEDTSMTTSGGVLYAFLNGAGSKLNISDSLFSNNKVIVSETNNRADGGAIYNRCRTSFNNKYRFCFK